MAGISIQALARAAGAHPVRLRALFRERYGGTIREYLTQYRLERALQEAATAAGVTLTLENGAILIAPSP